MNEIFALIELSGSSRNAERLGAYIAWLVANNLIAPSLQEQAGPAIVRVRMQDLNGPEFFTTVMHGELKAEYLTETGCSFTRRYLVPGHYDIDYESVSYDGEDEWLRYREISPKITAAYQAYIHPKSTLQKVSAKILQFPFRRK